MSQARCRLAANVEAPAKARAFVISHCPTCSTETLDAVRLLTTELVDNAMWHATPGPIWLDIETDQDQVMVGVTDPGGGPVKFAPASRWPETGHGLRLVHELSARWGVQPAASPSGKRVWFAVALTHENRLDTRLPVQGTDGLATAVHTRPHPGQAVQATGGQERALEPGKRADV